MAEADLLARVREWLLDDPDPLSRDALQRLVDDAQAGDARAQAELADAFAGSLQFGTAGLRGRLGPGPNRMNRAVVARAAAGLTAWLRGATIVIGYDARHGSAAFAIESAEVITGAGSRALMLPRALPTPVLAFAVQALRCGAGVMVTASHNPPQDNGYKVYIGDGAQIAPPVDEEIAAEIVAVGPVNELPRSDAWERLGDDIVTAYVDRVVDLVRASRARGVSIAYTPMHGVGGPIALEVFRRAGFPEPVVVAEQLQPDPDFPTVSFPNPEEPGAMDLALALAVEHGTDLVIANDPDADRCAVGIRERDGGYRMLTGDEVGALLGGWIIERARRRGETIDGAMAASIVSGSLLEAIARSSGIDFVRTLTGFKWISRAPGLVYGYEEALGYCVDPRAVRDKDGISAALLVAELAADLADNGRCIADLLDDLAVEHGVHATQQVSLRVDDLDIIGRVMAELRRTPPAVIGDEAVVSTVDLGAGWNGLPPTDGLIFDLAGGRVVVRPSGTEPKVKCYIEVVEECSGDVASARGRADSRLAAIASAMRPLLTAP